MLQKTKVVLSCLLLVAVGVAGFAAGAPETQQGATAAGKLPEMTITAFRVGKPDQWPNLYDEYVLKGKFNITTKYTIVPGAGWLDAAKLLIASGDYPEFMWNFHPVVYTAAEEAGAAGADPAQVLNFFLQPGGHPVEILRSPIGFPSEASDRQDNRDGGRTGQIFPRSPAEK